MLTALLIPGAKGPWTVLAQINQNQTEIRYEKEILYEGTFVHPSTGETHIFDRADLEHMALSSNRLVRDEGITVPFPDGHRFDARSNLGFWEDFEVKPSESAPGVFGLFGKVRVPLADDQKKVGKTITEVSAMIEPEMKLTSGDVVDGPVCTHVCATNYPVIPGQTNFVATLSRDGGEQKIEIEYLTLGKPAGKNQGDTNMNGLIKLLAVAFGIEPDASEEVMLAKAKEFFEAKKALETENATLLSDINVALGRKEDTTKTDREIKMEKELLVMRSEKAQGFLTTALKLGKLTKAESDVFSQLIAIGKTQVIPLGGTQTTEIDAFDLIKGLIESRPDGSMVNLAANSTHGAPNELETVKKHKANQAQYFLDRGYEVVWNDAEHTDFSVKRTDRSG